MTDSKEPDFIFGIWHFYIDTMTQIAVYPHPWNISNTKFNFRIHEDKLQYSDGKSRWKSYEASMQSDYFKDEQDFQNKMHALKQAVISKQLEDVIWQE